MRSKDSLGQEGKLNKNEKGEIGYKVGIELMTAFRGGGRRKTYVGARWGKKNEEKPEEKNGVKNTLPPSG